MYIKKDPHKLRAEARLCTHPLAFQSIHRLSVGGTRQSELPPTQTGMSIHDAHALCSRPCSVKPN